MAARALEGAVGAFGAMVALVVYPGLGCALAAQHQGILVDLNAHRLFGDAGQVDREDQGIIRLIDVDGIVNLTGER